MPITKPLKTGDVVVYQDTHWRIKLNGTTVYLYNDAETPPSRTSVRKTVLLKFGSLASGGGGGVPPGRVPSRYFYIVRDLDAAAEDRRIKLGISGNVPNTLRTYRRRVPSDQLICTVDCGTERAARALEAHCKRQFAEFRVDASEVYSCRPHEIIRALHKQGYRQQADGVFAAAKQNDAPAASSPSPPPTIGAGAMHRLSELRRIIDDDASRTQRDLFEAMLPLIFQDAPAEELASKVQALLALDNK